MSEANLVAVVKDIEQLFRSNSRNELARVITTFIIDCCVDKGLEVLRA